MSYLLEALKKAEQERLEAVSPELQVNKLVNVQAQLPKSLVVIVVVLVVMTIWQMFWKGDADIASHDNVAVKGKSVEPIAQPYGDGHDDLIHSQVTNNSQGTEVVDTEVVDPEVQVKSLSDLTSAELARIPSLELASHIYSSAPEYRSVVINGQTYSEGMLISAGLKLEEINQAGIVINIQGQKVELPKGISWVASQNVK